MSKSRVRNTDHVYKRVSERTNLSKSEAKRLIKQAQKYGKTYKKLPPGPLADYLKSKGKYKRVKIYEGYVFVFAKTSTSCITMYPIDEEIQKAQRIFDKKLNLTNKTE